MNPVAKALWFIESHFASEITLELIAQAGGVSRFTMARAFGEATGQSVMRYVRGRRLSEAAKALVAGAPDILAVALDAGYGSHEAFTRAFREQFGVTPEALRSRATLDPIQLTEPLDMNKDLLAPLTPPRFENSEALLLAGLSERYQAETVAGIPALWQRFGPNIGQLPGQVGQQTYGVCFNSDGAGSFDYLCGVEVADFAALPSSWTRLRIAPQRYAVFTHRGHISGIRGTCNAIWNQWLPQSGLEAADAPDFERYDERFDPHTGMGEVEVWIPVKA